MKKIPIFKGKLGEYRWAVRDIDANYSRSGGEPVYILSNQSPVFSELEKVLKFRESEKLPITIQFVRKFGKKFINLVE